MKLWHMGKTAPDIWGKGGVGALKRFGCHSSYPTSYPTAYPSSYPFSYPSSYTPPLPPPTREVWRLPEQGGEGLDDQREGLPWRPPPLLDRGASTPLFPIYRGPFSPYVRF